MWYKSRKASIVQALCVIINVLPSVATGYLYTDCCLGDLVVLFVCFRDWVLFSGFTISSVLFLAVRDNRPVSNLGCYSTVPTVPRNRCIQSTFQGSIDVKWCQISDGIGARYRLHRISTFWCMYILHAAPDPFSNCAVVFFPSLS